MIRAATKSEGEEAVELSLERIEMRRSSGKESKKSDFGMMGWCGEKRFLLGEAEMEGEKEDCVCVGAAAFFFMLVLKVLMGA